MASTARRTQARYIYALNALIPGTMLRNVTNRLTRPHGRPDNNKMLDVDAAVGALERAAAKAGPNTETTFGAMTIRPLLIIDE